jgi:NADPH:quinone reductase-like Zn-dependent oxidoreductase
MDVAGVIDQVGVGTDTNLQRGDPVMAMVNPIDKSGGAYAEYVVQAQWLWSHHLAQAMV